MKLSSQDESFRDEVRTFLNNSLTPDLRARAARQTGVYAEGLLAKEWQRVLHAKGWAAPNWPAEHGGTGWTPIQRYIFAREASLAGAPRLPGMGLQMCGPVIMAHGTAEQQAHHLPRILSGENYWCQGYSEPGAGSDLAAIATRATRDGLDYVVTGSKIWTTHAQYANWIFLLVRTDPNSKKQAGISFLLSPLDVPGIEIRPIRSMSGEHEVNAIFFDEVRVPVTNLVGAENDGWAIAKHLLKFERFGGSAGGRLAAALANLQQLALEQSGSGRDRFVAQEDWFRDRFAELEIEALSIDWMEQNIISRVAVGAAVDDSSSSMIKLLSSELTQRIAQLSVEVLGNRSSVDYRIALEDVTVDTDLSPLQLTATARYLNSRAATIFGGTSEIQRNIIARTALGL